MKKIILGIFLVSQLVLASLQTPIEAKITAINKINDTIEFEAKDMKIGEVGWIYINTTDYGAILYQAEVIRIKDSLITAKIKAYDALKQIYLPNPTNKPKVGDKVIFRKLNSRAFLIAPNLELYEQIKETHKEVKFMSSDLLIGYLYTYGNYDPTPKFLKNACDVYAVGLLYIVAENELAILECQSLKILDTSPLDTSDVKESISPFYSRIEPVKTGTLFSAFASKKSEYYFSYYTSLIHPNRSYQKMLQKEKPIIDAIRAQKKLAQKQKTQQKEHDQQAQKKEEKD